MSVYQMDSSLLTTVLDPNDSTDVVAVQLDMTPDDLDIIMSYCEHGKPFRHNRQCLFFSPNPFEDDGPHRPRLLVEKYPHYKIDVDVPGAHSHLERIYDTWLKDDK